MENKIYKRLHVNLSGVNLNRLFKKSKRENIELFNINRTDYKHIEFDVNFNELKKIREIARSENYTIIESQNFGFAKVKNFFKLRYGILIGAFFFIVLIILNSFFVWNIKIYGNERIETQKILNVLSLNDIKIGTIYHACDLNKVETNLLNQVDDISLCSIIRRGTTIIVNIKEKIYSSELETLNSSGDIVAKKDMTLLSVEVIQGTQLKKIGDSVKKGDIIVGGYYLDGSGNKKRCKANAKISAKTWYTASEKYYKQIEIFDRTGKKIISSYMSLFGMNFKSKNLSNKFEFFDVETKENDIFLNNFLPIKYFTKTYYETTKKLRTQNFLEDKEELSKKLQKDAYQQVCENDTISKIFDVVNEEKEYYFMTSYVEVIFTI